MTYSKYAQVFAKPKGRVRRGPPTMAVIKPEGEWLIPTLYIQRLIAQDCLEPTKAKLRGADGKTTEVKLPEPAPEVKDDPAKGNNLGGEEAASKMPDKIPATDTKPAPAKSPASKDVKTET